MGLKTRGLKIPRSGYTNPVNPNSSCDAICSTTNALVEPERGQTTVFAAAVLVVLVMSVGALAHVSRGVVDRAQAQRAADAVALAVAVRGDPLSADHVARVVAEANGAEVVRTRWVSGIVVITVRFGSVEATAAAEPISP